MILLLGQKVILSVLLEKLNANLSESTFIAWQGAFWRRVKRDSKKKREFWRRVKKKKKEHQV